jgi:V8-like Glu-specific endopeptidase
MRTLCSKRRILGGGASFIATAIVLALMSPFAHSQSLPNQSTDDMAVTAQAPPLPSIRSGQQGIDPAGYWTEEKMRNAIPADDAMAEDGQTNLADHDNNNDGNNGGNGSSNETMQGKDVTQPSAPLESGQQSRVGVSVPTTVGKVFSSYQGSDYVCSGSVINSPNKSVISTAAHCLHGGAHQGWHTNVTFAPAYNNGVSRFGLWNWDDAITFREWTDHTSARRDQAFFTVHHHNGQSLVDTVGGNGLSYNYGQRQNNVRIWGWPSDPPFTGQTPYRCDGKTYRRFQWSSDMRMACRMTGGASGGPWLLSRSSANRGQVFGVTSRRANSGTPSVVSTPFDDAVAKIFKDIG